MLDDDYHIVSHDNIQGNIDVDVTFTDLEKIKKELSKLLSRIPARVSIQSNEKSYNFNLESTGILLDEVSISAKRKRATIRDTREKPNSVHYRNTDYMCAGGVLNCSNHDPFWGYKSQDFSAVSIDGGYFNQNTSSNFSIPLHLHKDSNGDVNFKYVQSHSGPIRWLSYPDTFLKSIAAKARIRNIQEHFFKDEAIFGFYSDMISQAYAPLSLLYTSEIELPAVYSNAYFIVEIIHQPTGMRQQVVKKIQ